MGLYKEIEIPEELMAVIEYMRSLERDREELSALSQQWDLLTILGQMTGSGTDMTKTRADFKVLTAKLLSAMGADSLHKVVQSITSRAQVTVDIVIRNLFERTADIGFLATDDDIRSYVKIALDKASEKSEVEIRSDLLRQRFSDYVAKYSVYENIILLDTEGNLLCQHDTKNIIEKTDPELVSAALTTTNSFVETFSKSNLCPSKEKSLIYSFRVRESNDPDSEAVAILCLVFRFENEMKEVFQNLLLPDDWTILSILDANGTVIASSDASQVPINSNQTIAVSEEFKITRYGGRLYLTKTCPTKGYQGFRGLGWFGHAMIPIEYAFLTGDQSSTPKVTPKILHSVTDNPLFFSDELRAIPTHAKNIQSELNRTVWNGNLGTRGSGSAHAVSNKVLLWEISITGNKTKSVFERSINRLHQSVVNSILNEVVFVSSLAIDIMDRNLYERANDCRWWALTTSFKSTLEKTNPTANELDDLSNVLNYINSLYTVYTNILIFDRKGVVLAVSNTKEADLVGKTLTDSFVNPILMQTSTQSYCVSEFEKTRLYGQRPTYIYGAAIINSTTVGGIAIVFDSEPQFHQILEDCLPRDKKGDVMQGCFSVFVERDGMIISSTSNTMKIGEKVKLPEKFLSLKSGETYSEIVEVGTEYFAIGASCSKGYREYKGPEDKYKNDVIALTFMNIGKVQLESQNIGLKPTQNFKIRQPTQQPGINYVEIASFYIGNLWLGARSENVLASIVVDEITEVPNINPAVLGLVVFENQPIFLIDGRRVTTNEKSDLSAELIQAIVVKSEHGPVAITVDRLGEIPTVAESQIMANQLSISSDKTNYVEGVVRVETDQKVDPLFVLINTNNFVKGLMEGDAIKMISGLQDKAAGQN